MKWSWEREFQLLPLVVLIVLLVAILAFGQAPEKAPSLKEAVSLEIRNLQWEQFKLYAQGKQLEDQLRDVQRRLDDNSKTLTEKLGTALDQSGIDKTKFDLNPDTLAVTPKPEPPKK